VKLSGEDLSRYSNKIESVGPSVLSLAVSYEEIDVMMTNILQSLPNIMAEKQLA